MSTSFELLSACPLLRQALPPRTRYVSRERVLTFLFPFKGLSFFVPENRQDTRQRSHKYCTPVLISLPIPASIARAHFLGYSTSHQNMEGWGYPVRNSRCIGHERTRGCTAVVFKAQLSRVKTRSGTGKRCADAGLLRAQESRRSARNACWDHNSVLKNGRAGMSSRED